MQLVHSLGGAGLRPARNLLQSETLPKVLVVDDGERPLDRALSAELAELGFASVTASHEAADEVLALIRSPSAILLQMPADRQSREYASFIKLAERLKASDGVRVPVILVDLATSAQPGGYASLLEAHFGAQALAKPEL